MRIGVPSGCSYGRSGMLARPSSSPVTSFPIVCLAGLELEVKAVGLLDQIHGRVLSRPDEWVPFVPGRLGPLEEHVAVHSHRQIGVSIRAQVGAPHEHVLVIAVVAEPGGVLWDHMNPTVAANIKSKMRRVLGALANVLSSGFGFFPI